MLTRHGIEHPAKPVGSDQAAFFMIRIAALVVVIGSTLAVVPAVAQFNIFGDEPPPRPPADIPNGPFPPQPPPPGQYSAPAPASPYPAPAPGSPYPAALPPGSAPPPQSAIQAQPLPPPPGAAVAPAPGPGQGFPQQRPLPPERARAVPPAGDAGPQNGAPPAGAAPAAAEPADTGPVEDTVVEAPTQHIENGKAVFAGLDKITGRTFSFDAAIGETVRFGALEVTPRACYTRPPTEATNTDAFVEVDEVTLTREIKRIFTGWMFASSPGLHAVEHPIYDVWLTDCAAPTQSAMAEPAAAPPAAAAPVRARHPAPPRQHTARPAPRAVEPPPQ
jgi:hypothetical protein